MNDCAIASIRLSAMPMSEQQIQVCAAVSPVAGAADAPLLSIHNLQVIYGGAVEAVRDVSLDVRAGGIIALLGSNGAGKSTVLKSVSGVLDSEDGKVEKGQILFEGRSVEREHADRIVAAGIIQVPEGRRLFPALTVDENLTVGAHLRSRMEMEAARDRVFSLFPQLARRRDQIAGYLSGGEQQMVAIGRGLMSRPKILILDEPSLGLAPKIISDIFEVIVQLRVQDHLTILLVEQNASRALAIADYGYIMENGRIVLDGPADALRGNTDVQEFYLGIGNGHGRTNMKDVKHYKRRKRWLS